MFCSYCWDFKPSAKYFYHLSTKHFLIGLLARFLLLLFQSSVMVFFQKSMAALKDPQNDCDCMHLWQPVSGDWCKRNVLDSLQYGRMKPADQKKGARKRSERCGVSVKTKLHARKTHPDCRATWWADLSQLPLPVSCPDIILHQKVLFLSTPGKQKWQFITQHDAGGVLSLRDKLCNPCRWLPWPTYTCNFPLIC